MPAQNIKPVDETQTPDPEPLRATSSQTFPVSHVEYIAPSITVDLHNDFTSSMTPNVASWPQLDGAFELLDWINLDLAPMTSQGMEQDQYAPASRRGHWDLCSATQTPHVDAEYLVPPGSLPITSSSGPSTSSDSQYREENDQVYGDSDRNRGINLTRQIATRYGEFYLDEDNQLRYFGSTSNRHLFPNGIGTFFPPLVRDLRTHEITALENAGLNWPHDVHYEDTLTNLYFSWHASFLQEVNKEVYTRARRRYLAGEPTPLYSPALENAMYGALQWHKRTRNTFANAAYRLAIGALYTANKHQAITDKASDFFASRAKTLFEIEMDSPVLATLQTSILLSVHEGASLRDARGTFIISIIRVPSLSEGADRMC